MSQYEECSVGTCDIFDFITQHVGMAVLHPGGLKATKELIKACHIDKNTSATIFFSNKYLM